MFRRYNPDIFVSTDFMPNYTSLIFSVHKDKSGLFKKTRPKDETAISMSAWLGDFSQEHDEDAELPDAVYHADFYITDPYGGQDGCTIETFVEDSEKDSLPIIKEFDTADGGYAAAARLSVPKASRKLSQTPINAGLNTISSARENTLTEAGSYEQRETQSHCELHERRYRAFQGAYVKKVNGVTYYGAWSNVVTIKAGLPV